MLLIFSVLMLVSFIPSKPAPVKNTLYYYCWSRPFSNSNINGKTEILYTDVMQMENVDSLIRKRANQWANRVEGYCYNKKYRCTSDLNYATSLEDGKQQISRLLKRYADTSYYIVTKLNF